MPIIVAPQMVASVFSRFLTFNLALKGQKSQKKFFVQVTGQTQSMTSHQDHKVWQDVYNFPAEEFDIYLKIQIEGGVVIISFKEV